MLVMIVCLPDGPQEVYLVNRALKTYTSGDAKFLLEIDRNERFYAQQGLYFPHQDGPDSMHSNVVLDGDDDWTCLHHR